MAKSTTKKPADGKSQHLTIAPPNLQLAVFTIRGNAALVMHKFSEKAKEEMRKKQEAGSTAKKGTKKEPRDFKAMYESAKHISTQGWVGIPASAFRAAMISACRLVGFQMTRAKLCLFVVADGKDKDEGTGLVKITKGEPYYAEHCVRLETGVADIHARPMWDEGWEANLTVRFDADQFTVQDVANLLMRVGMQVGVLEGRPDSKDSAGMGWGTFDVAGKPASA